jgi:fructoselysine-6-P-deglycase FrlB-like protein
VSVTSFVEAEIASQPACWARAIELASSVRDQLPHPGERVAVVGCGTSWFMAQSYAVLRESAGQGETDAFAASEMPKGRRYDRVVAITRSGTTTEVLELLSQLHAVPTVAISASATMPVSDVADDVVVLDFADESAVVQTRFATTALVLLRAHLGEDLTRAIADVEQATTAALDDELMRYEQFTFLGAGWTCGIAQEAALKMREAAGAWVEAYPAMEYRHGPIAITGPNRVAWMFGAAPAGLAADVAVTGGAFRTSSLDPLADLVHVQRLAAARAVAAGLDPDRPRHLTRSVVLDDLRV